MIKFPKPDADNGMTWGKCFMMWLGCWMMCLGIAILFQFLHWMIPVDDEVGRLFSTMTGDMRWGVFGVMAPMTLLVILFRYLPGPAAKRAAILKEIEVLEARLQAMDERESLK